MNDNMRKASHPYVSVGVIISVITLTGTGFGYVDSINEKINTISGKADRNMTDISHERELRKAEESHINKKLDELSQDAKEIKNLINQLLTK